MDQSSRKTLTRRDFVRGTTGVLTAAWITELAGCVPQPDPAPPSEISIGVQLRDFRREMVLDYPGTLARIADQGFKGVEFFDRPEAAGYSAGDIKSMLDHNGLKSCGAQVDFHSLTGDRWEGTLGYHREVGTRKLIVRSIPEARVGTRDALIRTANLLNDIAGKLKPAGMQIGVHADAAFFGKIGSAYRWNVLADHTHEDVILQMDTSLVSQVPELNPVALLERNPGRSATIHVRPTSGAHPDTYFDRDELDWPAFIQASRTTAGVEWFIIDHEVPGTAKLDASKAACVSFVLKTGVFGMCSCLNDTPYRNT